MADNGLTIKATVAKSNIGEDGSGGFLTSTSESSWANSERKKLFLEDIEQSHHFIISIDKLQTYLPSYYRAPLNTEDQFLPVKSISFTEASIENMSIPLGVIGSLPILHRKNLGRLTMSIYDNDREPIERAIREWLEECFPDGKYVNYLSNIIGTMKYKSYGVTGKLNSAVSGAYYIIPADTFGINRSYDENGAKLIDFSVVVIGGAAY